MIIDYKKIENLQGIMQDLSNGIDPTSGISFQDDTILNNVVLKHAFATTSEILKDIIHKMKIIDRSFVSWSGDSFSNNATPTVKIAKQMI